MRVRGWALVGLSSLLASGCASGADEAAVRVTAVDYAFRGVPADLEAGPTVFTVRNEGAEGHDFILTRLVDEDVPIPEVIELPQAERERSLAPVARTIIVDPGGEARVDATLEPGRYAYLCLATTEAGRTHAYHGMWGSFSVA